MNRNEEIERRVDAVVDGFDEVRQRLQPTNGEALAIFAVLAADILQESPDDVGDALYEVVNAVLVTGAQDSDALKRLFDTCGLPAPRRKR